MFMGTHDSINYDYFKINKITIYFTTIFLPCKNIVRVVKMMRYPRGSSVKTKFTRDSIIL